MKTKRNWSVVWGIVFILIIVAVIDHAVRKRDAPFWQTDSYPTAAPETAETFVQPAEPPEELVLDRDYLYLTDSFYATGIYTGVWRGEKPEGKGAYTVASADSELFSTGDELEGVFSDGRLIDYGTLKKSDGSLYIGEFAGGVPEGTGIRLWPRENGSRYDGSWKAGQMSGQGEIWYGNGDYYSGAWENDKKNGMGAYQYANGDEYIGYFADSQRAGAGVMKYADGGLYEGDFALDKPNGTGRRFYNDGSVYNGEFVNGLREGIGEIHWPGGNTYKGDFTRDKRTGAGQILWSNGDVWVGEFDNGQLKVKTEWSETTEKIILSDGQEWTDTPLLIRDTLPDCVGFTLRFYLHTVNGPPDIGLRELNKDWRVCVYMNDIWKETGVIRPTEQNAWIETNIAFDAGIVQKVEVFPPLIDYDGAYRGSIELSQFKHE